MKSSLIFLLSFVMLLKAEAQTSNDPYYTEVSFPGGYQVGDCVEFLQVSPIDAGASGYYEVSISYTRNSLAAAATHLGSITHSNPAVWREVGRINNNGYVTSEGINFTVDCNTQYNNARFRLRAINNIGMIGDGLTVHIKVIPLNINSAWTPLNVAYSDNTSIGFLPMTNDWNLYVGNPFNVDGAKLALRADVNGNVGVGVRNPDAKLSVNGTIHSKEIKVDLSVPGPDYVFEKEYQLKPLSEIQKYIAINKHLPEVPSTKEMEQNGINLSEMNMLLLKKIEELTLHLIEQQKQIEDQAKDIAILRSK